MDVKRAECIYEVYVSGDGRYSYRYASFYDAMQAVVSWGVSELKVIKSRARVEGIMSEGKPLTLRDVTMETT